MSRAIRLEHHFVDCIPEMLDEGVLYVSIEYRAVMHKCCCGCGERVSTPLSPGQWKLTFDGETVSLSPSIGNGVLACNSHYFIDRNVVRWARPLTVLETDRALRRDRLAAVRHNSQSAMKLDSCKPGLWRSLFRVRRG